MSNLKVSADDSGGSSPAPYYRASPPATIDTQNEENLTKWATILELSQKELLQAIEAFGPVVRDIRRGLREQKNKAA